MKLPTAAERIARSARRGGAANPPRVWQIGNECLTDAQVAARLGVARDTATKRVKAAHRRSRVITWADLEAE